VAEFLLATAGVILFTVAVGLVRILSGPGDADRLMAAQLIGTGGIASLLLIAVATGAHGVEDVALGLALLAAFASRWAVFGGLAIFLYVGAEVSIGSMMINFLQQPSIMNVSYETAGRLLGLYWGGAMVGRALGSAVLIRAPANRVLAAAAIAALALCLVVTQESGLVTLVFGGTTAGRIAGTAALAVGFFNSVMFPTIFTLTLERSTAPTASTSGLLCMAIVGGAVLPVVTGYTADRMSLSAAFFVPFVSYVCIAIFALSGVRKSARIAAPPISA